MSESVQSNSAVLVHFTLKLDDGTTAESTRNNGKPALFRLGDASLSEGLEQHLLGLKVGDKTTFSLDYTVAENRSFSPIMYVYNPDIQGKENLTTNESISQSKSTRTIAQSDYILTYNMYQSY